MYTVINTNTGKTFTVSLDLLSKLVGGIDEDFFTDIFTSHTIETSEGKFIVFTEGFK